ncbi:hypothetical protein [Microbacterium sp. PMB16]|uniref:hypothetical protein n=1 Tax=Microbacterium sp. PMB16 TaxID=3120157 RepID=UPI003F4B63F8
MRIGRSMTVGALLVSGVILTACTEARTDPEVASTPSPTSSVEPSVSPDPDAASRADEALLPLAVDEIPAWAGTAVPDSGASGYVGGLSGWLGENSGHQMSTFQSLEPGLFQAHLACRGDGEITVTAGELDGEGAADPLECTNGGVVFDVTTTRTGLRVQLDLEGAPSIFAVSLVRIG